MAQFPTRPSILSAVAVAALACWTADPVAQVVRTLQSVASLEELRARTPDEQTRAAHFDRATSPTPSLNELIASGDCCLHAHDGSPSVDVDPTTFLYVNGVSPNPEQQERERVAFQNEQSRNLRRASICSRTAIVIGTAESGRSLANRSSTWLFTDYSVAIQMWIYPRDAPRARPQVSTERLLWSEIDGEVMVGGRMLSTTHTGWQSAVGKESLFMLAPIAGTTGFGGWAVEIKAGHVNDRFTQTDYFLEDYIDLVTQTLASCERGR